MADPTINTQLETLNGHLEDIDATIKRIVAELNEGDEE